MSDNQSNNIDFIDDRLEEVVHDCRDRGFDFDVMAHVFAVNTAYLAAIIFSIEQDKCGMPVNESVDSFLAKFKNNILKFIETIEGEKNASKH